MPVKVGQLAMLALLPKSVASVVVVDTFNSAAMRVQISERIWSKRRVEVSSLISSSFCWKSLRKVIWPVVAELGIVVERGVETRY